MREDAPYRETGITRAEGGEIMRLNLENADLRARLDRRGLRLEAATAGSAAAMGLAAISTLYSPPAALYVVWLAAVATTWGVCKLFERAREVGS